MAATTALRWLEDLVADSIWGDPYTTPCLPGLRPSSAPRWPWSWPAAWRRDRGRGPDPRPVDGRPGGPRSRRARARQLLRRNAPRASSTRDTVSLNVGAEHLFVYEGAIVPLRLGLGWEPQGAMDPVTRDPVDYLLVSLGSGYNNNRFKLDAAVTASRTRRSCAGSCGRSSG